MQGRLFKPRPILSVCGWAERFRYLGKGVSAKSKHSAVRYRSSLAPHQIEPQESFLDKSVQLTVLCMASQIGGKTEMLNNLVGYHVHWNPTGIVMMYPTIESAEKYSKKKASPMFRESPCFKDLILPERQRGSGNTISVKEFPGGAIYFVGANSPASLRGASGELLIGDEIDSFEEQAGDEGDPVELLWKRGESYPTCVKVLASTPTHPHGRIWQAFKSSDQRYWFVPCPKCGEFQTLIWSQMQWPKGETKKAVYLCGKCATALDDKQRLEMYYNGRWQPTADFNGIRGYHLNWIYCPWPAHKGFENRLHEMAEEFTKATHKGPSALKVLVNTGFCEPWEEEGEKIEVAPLLERREEYGPELPAGVLVLTCAVDTQGDRLEVDVAGWGFGEEYWAIMHRKIFGNPHTRFKGDVWDRLDELLQTRFVHPYGHTLKIHITGIDEGGNDNKNLAFTKPVQSFVKRHTQASRGQPGIVALKGSSTPGAPIAAQRLQFNGINLLLVGTDTCKSTVYDRLKITDHGPRFIHFPKPYRKIVDGQQILVDAGYDEERFFQLVAEKKVKSKRHGFDQVRWEKLRARNEQLDLNGYQIALFELLNPDLQAIYQRVKPSSKEYVLKPAEQFNPSPSPVVESKPVAPVARPRRRLPFRRKF